MGFSGLLLTWVSLFVGVCLVIVSFGLITTCWCVLVYVEFELIQWLRLCLRLEVWVVLMFSVCALLNGSVFIDGWFVIALVVLWFVWILFYCCLYVFG